MVDRDTWKKTDDSRCKTHQTQQQQTNGKLIYIESARGLGWLWSSSASGAPIPATPFSDHPERKRRVLPY